MNESQRRKRPVWALISGIGLLISLVVVILLIGDFQKFRDSWHNLQWKYLVWLAPLAALNHAIRYWRWEILLKYVSELKFSRSKAIIIFCASSLLNFTPGRAGEIAKSLYAREFFGIPVSKSLPVLIAERLSDGLVMASLASLGLFLIGADPSLLAGGLIVVIILVIVILRTSILAHLVRWKPLGFLRNSGVVDFLNQANLAQVALLTRSGFIPNLALGYTAWLVEVMILFLILVAFGIEIPHNLFLLSLAIFPLASLAGGLSILPSGLGVTEGGIVALGVLVGGLSKENAVLAALLTRLAISGVIVIAGVFSIPFLHRMSRPE